MSHVVQAARIVSQQPDLQFPIKSDRAQSWLLTSYLDEVRSWLKFATLLIAALARGLSLCHWLPGICHLHHLAACPCAECKPQYMQCRSARFFVHSMTQPPLHQCTAR